MFDCKVCSAKDRHIEFLEIQNKDLYDRLMAFNKDAFLHYKAESRVGGELLYPKAVDVNGDRFSYEGSDPQESNSEILSAMGEDPVTVEDKK